MVHHEVLQQEHELEDEDLQVQGVAEGQLEVVAELLHAYQAAVQVEVLVDEETSLVDLKAPLALLGAVLVELESSLLDQSSWAASLVSQVDHGAQQSSVVSEEGHLPPMHASLTDEYGDHEDNKKRTCKSTPPTTQVKTNSSQV